MADPLSIAASLIAVVQISGGIISLCYDYRRSVQDAKKEVATLQREVQSLRDVIEQLLKLLETDDNHYYLPLLKKLIASNDSFQEYEDQFKKLEDRLRSPISKWRQLGNQLMWPLKERDLMKDLGTIHRMKSILEIGLATDTAFSIMEIRNNTRDLRDRIVDFQGEKSLSEQQKLQLMLEWLGAPNPSFKHNDLRKKRAKDTGSWLLFSDAFITWREAKNSTFWLYGIPGCGKSVLSSVVIEHIRQHGSFEDRAVALAYYHFDFSDEVTSRLEPMLRSLISQLSSWHGEPPDSLEKCVTKLLSRKRYKYKKDVVYREDTAQPSTEDLMNVLHGITEEFDEIVLVIDALDECLDQEELLENLTSILSWNAKCLRVFLSSRNTPGISTALDSKATQKIEAASMNVGEDINRFIQEQLATHPKLRKWPAILRNEIQEILRSQAHGMFRWVDCQISILGKCVTTRDVKKTLKSLPKTLSDTYTSALRSIEEAHWDYAIRILMFLAISPKPLTIGEAVEVLAIDFETEETPFFDEDLRMPDQTDILTMCATLVTPATIRQLGADGEIIEVTELRLAHHTVKEYLLSELFKLNLPYKCPFKDEQEVYTYAAEVSLAYLLALQQSLDPELLVDRPLSRYAAESWLYYYERSQPGSNVLRLAVRLLQDDGETEPYRNWCRLFDITRPWRQPNLDRIELPSPLYYMCAQGAEAIVLQLLQAGADPNSGKLIYGTCLQSAASKGHVRIVKALLEAGANPNDSADDYQEGLYCNSIVAASAAGHETIVALLLEYGADPNNKSRFPTYGSALTKAARRNSVGIVKLLIDAGADPNSYNSKPRDVNPLEAAASRGYKECVALMLPKASEKTALGGLRVSRQNRELIEVFVPFIPDGVMYYAAGLGYEDMVTDLLAKGAKPETQVNHGYKAEQNYSSSLSEACKMGHFSIAKRLVENGADVNAKSKDRSSGTFPLANATIGGYADIVDLLLQHGAEVNANGQSGPALQIACFEGHADIVKTLMDHGASLTCGDGRYGGPVQAAVLGNHLDILELVVSAGADVNLRAGEARIMGGGVGLYQGPIHAAVATSNTTMLDWLLDHGADVSMRDIKSGFGVRSGPPLTVAAEAGHIEMLRRLLEAGADVNQVGESSYSSPPIFEAVKKENPDVVKYLLSAGADPNALGSYYGDRITTLTQACMRESAEVVEALLEAGADVHKFSAWRDQDEPALITAARDGTIDIIRTLVRHGANVNEQAKHGWTALHAAARRGRHDVIHALLFEFSADPNLELVNGSLPIHSAASWDHPECIDVLVQGGTDINARNKNGRTALHWAAASDHRGEVSIQWLLDHGADYTLEEHGTRMTARDYVEWSIEKTPEYVRVDKAKILKIFDTHMQSRCSTDALLDEQRT
ncbi:ankyrin repeat-containing domain protein [Hypoxylon fuscum]|nr:ankyrin repeat-containing domain protein [Hypoxylon fuscum]